MADGKARRVTDTLRSRITDGTYAAGGSLPGAAHLADELNVSVGTVRTALLYPGRGRSHRLAPGPYTDRRC